MSNRKLLDYHDVLLYRADAELLQSPHWLNDQASRSCHLIICKCSQHTSFQVPTKGHMLMQVIAFFFEYYSREKHSSDHLSFCPGSLTYLLLQSGEPNRLCLHRLCQPFGGLLALPVIRLKEDSLAADRAEVSVITAPLKVGQDSHYKVGHRTIGTYAPEVPNMQITLWGHGRQTALCVVQLAERRLILFALNDNPDAETANGGSHW